MCKIPVLAAEPARVDTHIFPGNTFWRRFPLRILAGLPIGGDVSCRLYYNSIPYSLWKIKGLVLKTKNFFRADGGSTGERNSKFAGKNTGCTNTFVQNAVICGCAHCGKILCGMAWRLWKASRLSVPAVLQAYGLLEEKGGACCIVVSLFCISLYASFQCILLVSV